MTTAQDQQSRATREDFESWSVRANQGYDLTRNHSGGMKTFENEKTEHAWRGFFHGWKAARALPAGMMPVAKIHNGKLTWNIPWPEYSVGTVLLTGSHDLFTAAQVLAMGRVPLNMEAAWDAFAEAVRVKVGVKELVNIMGSVESLRAIFLAAAPRPPAAQEKK